jgi:hypothetical protein
MLSLRTEFLGSLISLNSLVYSCEALLEHHAEDMDPDKHKLAMNCVYILGEINAVVLDEARQMSSEEHDVAVAEVQRLTALVVNASSESPRDIPAPD